MLPTQERIKELQERFGVRDGQFWGEYYYKNLNWYLGSNGILTPLDDYEWFCFGDIREEDVERVHRLLQPNEILALGWKDMARSTFLDGFFGTGGGPWLVMTQERVEYDKRAGDLKVDR